MNGPASLNPPSWWRGADFYAKVSWLKIRLGCSYEEACSVLGRRKRKAVKITKQPPLWWQKDN